MAKTLIRVDRKISSTLESIEQCLTDGTLNLPTLVSNVKELSLLVQDPIPTIELVFLSEFESELECACRRWLGINTPIETEKRREIEFSGIKFELLCRKFEPVHSSKIAQLDHSIKFLLINDKDFQTADWRDKALAYALDSVFVIFLTETEQSQIRGLINEVREPLLYVDAVNLADEKNPLFDSTLQNPDFQTALSALYNYNAARAIESAKVVIQLGIEQEKRSLRAKQAINKKQVIKLQSVKGLSSSDCLNEIKKIVSTQTRTLLKGLEDSLERAINSKNSAFILSSNKMSDALENLEEEKKSKEVVYKIPDEFSRNYQEQIRVLLLKAGHDQLVMMHDALKEIEKEITEFLNKEQIPMYSLSFKFLSDQRLRDILDDIVHWERTYEGTALKKGFYDYFMAVRKYQMFVFLIASAFGLSFIRDLKLYMIPFTILLMGIGSFFVYNSVKKERIEKMEKEIEKARQTIQSEVKKIASEFVKLCQKLIRDHIEVQESSILSDAENHIKSYFSAKKRNEDEEKNKTQRQAQSLDSFDRKFQSLVRFEEDLSKNIERLKSELRLTFRESIRKTK